MERLAHTMQSLQRVTLWLAALALALMPIFTFYDVVMRYLFHAPTIWVTEISLYMLQFLVFVPAGMLLVDGAHLRVTVWIEALSGRARRLAEIVTALLVLPYAGALIWYGWNYTQRAFDRGMLSPTLLQVPLWMVYLLIPLGGALLVVGVIVKCMLEIGRLRGTEAVQ